MTSPRSADPNTYMVDLLVDENTALATPRQFHDLNEYSTSLPTGQYVGKRWKRREPWDAPPNSECRWYLGEFYETDSLTEQHKIGILWRELLVVE